MNQSQQKFFKERKKVEGEVYVLMHPLKPNIVKVGSTSRTADVRAKELTDLAKTSLALNFVVVYAHKTRDYAKLEKIVHERLKEARIQSNREFFTVDCGAERVVKTILDAEKEIDKQLPILEEEKDLLQWWKDLEPVWKYEFKKGLEWSTDPEPEDLIEGVYSMITYSRKSKLRSVIGELIKNVDFEKRILKWYDSLTDDLRIEVNAFVSRELSKKQLIEITNKENVDCSGNKLIQSLSPLKRLHGLKELNISDTSISNLESLKNLRDLEVLKLNMTYVSDLEPIIELNLKVLECYSTNLDDEELEIFRTANPRCDIKSDPFNS